MTPTDTRLLTLRTGYDPIPCNGKRPVMEDWATRDRTNAGEVTLWSQQTFPFARETGLRCKFMPTIDIDIMDADVSKAIEDLAREHFEERGTIMVRIGQAPKRAIPLRTDEPFKKVSRSFIPANGIHDSQHPPKVEILCDGQQVIAFGIHPDTHQRYSWTGGEPGEIAREDLPYVREGDMVAFLDAVENLLITEFGWKALAKRPKANGGELGGNGSADWGLLYANIIAGRDLHDSILALAGKKIRDGASGGATVNQIRALMEAATCPHDERWQERYDDIARTVAYAQEEETNKTRAAERARTAETWERTAAIGALEGVVAVFNKWLRLKDITPIYVVLGTVAANLLPGDPVWLGLIAPPSSAKTEILNSISRLPFVIPAATLTVPSLLSGTPKKEKAAEAKGGLLRKIGAFGIMVQKDFGSVLSMRPDQKNEVIGALREIFDGAWTRHVGSEGGRELHWSGKMGLIFGCTEAYDEHYGVIGSLGDRFVLYRLRPDYEGQLRKAIDHRGQNTKTMRTELACVVAALFAAPLDEPDGMTDTELQRLDEACALAIHLRAHVGRNRHYRDIETVHAPEGPGRLGLCLERLFCGLVAIGLGRDRALQIIIEVALDSCPQDRRTAFNLLGETPKPTREVADAMKLPTNTTRRVLEDITAQGLAVRTLVKKADDESGGDMFGDAKKKKRGPNDLWAVHPNWMSWCAERRDGSGPPSGI